jgi:hypothetical protein
VSQSIRDIYVSPSPAFRKASTKPVDRFSDS